MAVKVMPFKHKGQDVFICTGNVSRFINGRSALAGCGTVVENLNPSAYFPQGYHYDVCPRCKADLDYANTLILKPEKFNETDYEVLARWAKEKFKS